MTIQHITLKKVCGKVAPLWPLKNYVAVNPYLGFTDTSFQETARMMAGRSDVRMTMPLEFYMNEFETGGIKRAQLEEALLKNGQFNSLDEFLEAANSQLDALAPQHRFQTIIDTIDDSDGTINQIMKDSISRFMAAYLDDAQAIWKTERKGLLSTWIKEASIDLTPQLAGIPGFRKLVKMLPGKVDELVTQTTQALHLEPEETEAYFHTLILKLSGWAGFLSGIDWDNKLYGQTSALLEELLCILLAWEYVTYKALGDKRLIEKWKIQKSNFNNNRQQEYTIRLELELIFQDAFDLSHQVEFIQKINDSQPERKASDTRPIQSIFCIDVRSELMRRNIESVNSRIETIGFAGFFGMSIKYKSSAWDEGENLCPVLIPSGPTVTHAFKDKTQKIRYDLRISDKIQFERTWKSYKSGVTSAFSFVSILGVTFLPKLIRQSFSIFEKDTKSKHATPRLDLTGMTLEVQVEMAANALKLMGLKDRLSELVLIFGHGSSSTNNPHATGLDCGACGGHSGEINALTAAQIFNDPKVRAELKRRGMEIPESTLFVAGLHNTTSDAITLYTPDNPSQRQAELLEEARESFSKASILSRSERAMRFSDPGHSKVLDLTKRGKDWSQVRPEWGLSGCNSFIVGDRDTTKNIHLEGQAFLHNYDWEKDENLSILETIMTAPMVVTSWINLQYFASVTDNKNFGSGNKTLHNVTSGIGVLEGLGGDLKTGLPIQSLHDGKHLQHLPYRLKVLIKAPTEAISRILEKHPEIQALFDNDWIKLFRINDKGKVSHKYQAGRSWEALEIRQSKTSNTTIGEACLFN